MGQASASQVRAEFERRAREGEFRTVAQAPGAASEQYTTATMLRMERETIGRMQEGNRAAPGNASLVMGQTRADVLGRHSELNGTQQRAADQIFQSQEKIVGLDGVAGAGKTTTLAVIREGLEANGYEVEGFAPTSRAAQQLSGAGIETSTLQAHLAKGQKPDTGEKRVYILDESSLASTKQMHDFVSRLHPNDRVLLVGDTRQHEAVEAGRPFAQLQETGMKTVKLDEIVRQCDPGLKNVVEELAHGRVGEAIDGLERQGRVHEVKDQGARVEAIAKEYARSPENTLVVSPDNRSRTEINARIHSELQEKGVVDREEYRIDALVPRQDLTGAGRTWAAQYQVNDVLLYSRTSKETGIDKGEYARVKSVDAPHNLLTVVRIYGNGQVQEHTYDPRRQQGVSIYREQEKAFSVGDRIQFTAPANDLKVANRELGTIQSITDDGRISLKMDSGRALSFDPEAHPHLDHGYAVTSHSSQGQTADRVLINIDTELGAKDLLNNRMAYVAVSRGAHDAQIFTSDRQQLPQALSRDVSHQSAHVPEIRQETGRAIQPEVESKHAEQVYTAAEHHRHREPLNNAVTPQEANQFEWKQESGTIQSYQHVGTGRHIHIDGPSGQFYNQNREPITAKQGLHKALPEGQSHSHSQDKPEHRIERQGYGLGL